MKINIKRLSVLIALLIISEVSKADSLFLSAENMTYSQAEQEKHKDQIIPLIYIKNIEYYNKTQSEEYTSFITNYLSSESDIIVTEDESVADYDLIPKLIQSKIEPINDKNLRYAMTVQVELLAKGGVKINSAEQSRYIVVEKTQNIQLIARQLLKNLLQNALSELILKIRKNKFATI